MNVWIPLLLTLLVGNAGAALATPTTGLPNAPNVNDPTDRLRAAVADSAAKLGPLEPWQRKIFDDEVVPQYQRFIRDYRNTGAVDVDVESIRQYLKFFAPVALKLEHPKVLVFLRSEPGCDKCQLEQPAIRALAERRMAHRGLTPIWLGENEVDRSFTGRALGARLTELAANRLTQGILAIEWRLKPVDDIDSAHADEKHYEVKTWLRFPALGDRAGAPSGGEGGELDVLENDSIEMAAGKLLTDAMTAMGAELVGRSAVASDAANEDLPEVWIEARGFTDYAQYAKLKEALSARLRGKLGDATLIQERRLTRGAVTFAAVPPRAVPGDRTQAVKIALGDFSVGGIAFSVTGETAHETR